MSCDVIQASRLLNTTQRFIVIWKCWDNGQNDGMEANKQQHCMLAILMLWARNMWGKLSLDEKYMLASCWQFAMYLQVLLTFMLFSVIRVGSWMCLRKLIEHAGAACPNRHLMYVKWPRRLICWCYFTITWVESRFGDKTVRGVEVFVCDGLVDGQVGRVASVSLGCAALR